MKIKLPVVGESEGDERGIDTMRRALGGRLEGTGEGEVGALVEVVGRVGGPVVLLHADANDGHVWLGGGRMMRVAREALRPYDGDVEGDLAAVSRDARRFGALVEGERVVWMPSRPESELGHGVLVEKCRFGGLTQRADGVVVAVGFRRLWRDSLWGAGGRRSN